MLQVLEDSKTVNFVYHCNDPSAGMELTRDDTRYKLFIGDIGLFVTLAFWDKNYTENIIYQKLLTDKLEANLGYIFENFVAQMLVSSGNKLFYYTWPKDDRHSYEIDLIISHGVKIRPVEVKSSGYATHVSLDEFYKKFHRRIDEQYLIYGKDLKKDSDGPLLVPVYLTPFL